MSFATPLYRGNQFFSLLLEKKFDKFPRAYLFVSATEHHGKCAMSYELLGIVLKFTHDLHDQLAQEL
jgi:hypothetical protein